MLAATAPRVMGLQPETGAGDGPPFRTDRLAICSLTPCRAVQVLDDDELDKLGVRANHGQFGCVDILIDTACHDFHYLRRAVAEFTVARREPCCDRDLSGRDVRHSATCRTSCADSPAAAVECPSYWTRSFGHSFPSNGRCRSLLVRHFPAD